MQHPALSDDRRPVKAHVFIHCHGHFQSATVVDFSQGGLQLEQTFALFVGDVVEIELLSGALVPATVAWSLGGRTGVAFSEPLPETHPAMAELARSAARPSARHPIPTISSSRAWAASALRR